MNPRKGKPGDERATRFRETNPSGLGEMTLGPRRFEPEANEISASDFK
jgi:hypothetical protein